MTKKLFAVIMLLVLCSVLITVRAEVPDITLHSGVKIGMTINEVIACEASNNIALEKGESGNELWHPQKGTYYETADYVKAAGQDGTHILYYFDKNGKLTSCVYQYNGMLAYFLGTETLDIDVLLNTLKGKYGTPSASRTADAVYIGSCVDATDCCNCVINQDSDSRSKTKVKDFHQWIVPTSDGAIDIQVISLQYDGSFPSTFRYISYSLITQEELNKATQQKNSTMDSLNNDL